MMKPICKVPGATCLAASIVFACARPDLALAAPDISVAAIASGRLYVAGTSERPHKPITLEERFQTESDDDGRYQFEAIYHPARCIVAVQIEGKTYEAVVSNCGQQGPPGEPESAQRTGAVVAPTILVGPPGPPGPAVPAKAVETDTNSTMPATTAEEKPALRAATVQIKRQPTPPRRPKPPRKPRAEPEPADPENT